MRGHSTLFLRAGWVKRLSEGDFNKDLGLQEAAVNYAPAAAAPPAAPSAASAGAGESNGAAAAAAAAVEAPVKRSKRSSLIKILEESQIAWARRATAALSMGQRALREASAWERSGLSVSSVSLGRRGSGAMQQQQPLAAITASSYGLKFAPRPIRRSRAVSISGFSSLPASPLSLPPPLPSASASTSSSALVATATPGGSGGASSTSTGSSGATTSTSSGGGGGAGQRGRLRLMCGVWPEGTQLSPALFAVQGMRAMLSPDTPLLQPPPLRLIEVSGSSSLLELYDRQAQPQQQQRRGPRGHSAPPALSRWTTRRSTPSAAAAATAAAAAAAIRPGPISSTAMSTASTSTLRAAIDAANRELENRELKGAKYIQSITEHLGSLQLAAAAVGIILPARPRLARSPSAPIPLPLERCVSDMLIARAILVTGLSSLEPEEVLCAVSDVALARAVCPSHVVAPLLLWKADNARRTHAARWAVEANTGDAGNDALIRAAVAAASAALCRDWRTLRFALFTETMTDRETPPLQQLLRPFQLPPGPLLLIPSALRYAKGLLVDVLSASFGGGRDAIALRGNVAIACEIIAARAKRSRLLVPSLSALRLLLLSEEEADARPSPGSAKGVVAAVKPHVRMYLHPDRKSIFDAAIPERGVLSSYVTPTVMERFESFATPLQAEFAPHSASEQLRLMLFAISANRPWTLYCTTSHSDLLQVFFEVLPLYCPTVPQAERLLRVAIELYTDGYNDDDVTTIPTSGVIIRRPRPVPVPLLTAALILAQQNTQTPTAALDWPSPQRPPVLLLSRLRRVPSVRSLFSLPWLQAGNTSTSGHPFTPPGGMYEDPDLRFSRMIGFNESLLTALYQGHIESSSSGSPAAARSVNLRFKKPEAAQESAGAALVLSILAGDLPTTQALLLELPWGASSTLSAPQKANASELGGEEWLLPFSALHLMCAVAVAPVIRATPFSLSMLHLLKAKEQPLPRLTVDVSRVDDAAALSLLSVRAHAQRVDADTKDTVGIESLRLQPALVRQPPLDNDMLQFFSAGSVDAARRVLSDSARHPLHAREGLRSFLGMLAVAKLVTSRNNSCTRIGSGSLTVAPSFTTTVALSSLLKQDAEGFTPMMRFLLTTRVELESMDGLFRAISAAGPKDTEGESAPRRVVLRSTSPAVTWAALCATAPVSTALAFFIAPAFKLSARSSEEAVGHAHALCLALSAVFADGAEEVRRSVLLPYDVHVDTLFADKDFCLPYAPTLIVSDDEAVRRHVSFNLPLASHVNAHAGTLTAAALSRLPPARLLAAAVRSGVLSQQQQQRGGNGSGADASAVSGGSSAPDAARTALSAACVTLEHAVLREVRAMATVWDAAATRETSTSTSSELVLKFLRLASISPAVPPTSTSPPAAPQSSSCLSSPAPMLRYSPAQHAIITFLSFHGMRGLPEATRTYVPPAHVSSCDPARCMHDTLLPPRTSLEVMLAYEGELLGAGVLPASVLSRGPVPTPANRFTEGKWTAAVFSRPLQALLRPFFGIAGPQLHALLSPWLSATRLHGSIVETHCTEGRAELEVAITKFRATCARAYRSGREGGATSTMSGGGGAAAAAATAAVVVGAPPPLDARVCMAVHGSPSLAAFGLAHGAASLGLVHSSANASVYMDGQAALQKTLEAIRTPRELELWCARTAVAICALATLDVPLMVIRTLAEHGGAESTASSSTSSSSAAALLALISVLNAPLLPALYVEPVSLLLPFVFAVRLGQWGVGEAILGLLARKGSSSGSPLQAAAAVSALSKLPPPYFLFEPLRAGGPKRHPFVDELCALLQVTPQTLEEEVAAVSSPLSALLAHPSPAQVIAAQAAELAAARSNAEKRVSKPLDAALPNSTVHQTTEPVEDYVLAPVIRASTLAVSALHSRCRQCAFVSYLAIEALYAAKGRTAVTGGIYFSTDARDSFSGRAYVPFHQHVNWSPFGPPTPAAVLQTLFHVFADAHYAEWRPATSAPQPAVLSAELVQARARHYVGRASPSSAAPTALELVHALLWRTAAHFEADACARRAHVGGQTHMLPSQLLADLKDASAPDFYLSFGAPAFLLVLAARSRAEREIDEWARPSKRFDVLPPRGVCSARVLPDLPTLFSLLPPPPCARLDFRDIHDWAFGTPLAPLLSLSQHAVANVLPHIAASAERAGVRPRGSTVPLAAWFVVCGAIGGWDREKVLQLLRDMVAGGGGDSSNSSGSSNSGSSRSTGSPASASYGSASPSSPPRASFLCPAFGGTIMDVPALVAVLAQQFLIDEKYAAAMPTEAEKTAAAAGTGGPAAAANGRRGGAAGAAAPAAVLTDVASFRGTLIGLLRELFATPEAKAEIAASVTAAVGAAGLFDTKKVRI